MGAGPINPTAADLLGRRAETEAAEALFNRTLSGNAQVMLAVGDPGIGKTALLDALSDLAEESGATVLRASGDETETDLALGVTNQLLQASNARPLRAGEDPFAAGAALVDSWTAGRGATAVLIDDAHWADAASLQAIAFALRRVASAPVFAAIVSRTDAVELLPSALRRLSQGSTGVTVQLRGLDASTLGQLLQHWGAPRMSLAQVQRICDHTAGNPLHALTLVRELPPEEFLADPSTPLPAPANVAPLILAQVASLPTDAADFVVAAAVVGAPTRVSVVGEMAGVRDADQAAADAAAVGLLTVEQAPGGAVVRFEQPTARSAVYFDLPPQRVAALHRVAAGLVGDEHERLWHRLHGCEHTDDGLAAEAEAAGNAAAQRGAWSEGAALLEAASAVAASDGNRDRLRCNAELLRAYGGGSYVIGKQPTGPDAGPERLLLAGTVCITESRFVDGEALLRLAWAKVDATADPVLASRIALRLSDAAQGQLRPDEALTWSARAVDVLPAGITPLGEDPLTDLAFALLGSGRGDEARALFEDRVVPGTDTSMAGLLARATVRLWSDQLKDARDDVTACIAHYQRVGPPHKAVESLIIATDTYYRLGGWDNAEAFAHEALTLASDLDIPQLLALSAGLGSFTPAARGQWELAEERLEIAQRAQAARGSYHALGTLWMGRAHLAAARQDYGGVIDVLGTLSAIAQALPVVDEQVMMPWRSLLGAAFVHVDRVDEAELQADALSTFAEKRGDRSALAAAARLRGLVTAARGKIAAADRELRHAADTFSAVLMPFEAAQARLELGEAFLSAGRHGDALVALRGARHSLLYLGAAPYVERCDDAIALVGAEPAGTNAVAALTASERAVAELVAAGKSNREVAEELVVSVRTVESHLGRIYAKLGVTSRSQLVVHLRG